MKPHEIEITIDKSGKVQAHIEGIKGKKCMDIAKMIEDIVGRIEETHHTSEYYQDPDVGVGSQEHLDH